MNKIQKGLIAILHPFKFYKLSSKLSKELDIARQDLHALNNNLKNEKEKTLQLNKNLTKQKETTLSLAKDLAKEKETTLSLAKDLAKEKADSIYYIFPQIILGKNFTRHDRTKKQILILGYYGATNYGDELMLKAILDKADKYSEYSVTFFKNYRYNFEQWPNCFAYSLPDSMDDFDKITNFYDELIIGGGAHIDDKNYIGPGFIPFLSIELSLLFLKQNKKVRWIGVSSNKELYSTEYINKLKTIVDSCNEFSVRDPYTLNLLVNRYGFDKNKIKLTDDLALSIGFKKIIGVTLLDDFNNKNQNIQLVKEIVEFVKNNNNRYRICFITFYNERHHDKKMYKNIIKEIDLEGVEYFIASEYDTVENMYLVISGCDLFVNMRYHASLMSLSYNKPTISICYDIHPHYYNKMTYINEKYKNPYVLSYSNYKDGQLLEALNKISKSE